MSLTFDEYCCHENIHLLAIYTQSSDSAMPGDKAGNCFPNSLSSVFILLRIYLQVIENETV